MKKILGILFLLISAVAMSQEHSPGDTVCIMTTKSTGIISVQELYQENGKIIELRVSGFKDNSPYVDDEYSDELSKTTSTYGFYKKQPQIRVIECGHYRKTGAVISNQYNITANGYSDWYDNDIIINGECPDKFNKKEKDVITKYIKSFPCDISKTDKQKKRVNISIDEGALGWTSFSFIASVWLLSLMLT